MNGTTPIADVTVILGLTSETSMCSMSGVTNASGVATIDTKRLAWRGNGAPAGDYAITIAKSPKFEPELSLAEFQKLDPMAQEHYNTEQARRYDALPREVPIELSEFSISPFRMTVSKGGENRLDIDISTVKLPTQKPTRRP
jgi:hypothetical protein